MILLKFQLGTKPLTGFLLNRCFIPPDVGPSFRLLEKLGEKLFEFFKNSNLEINIFHVCLKYKIELKFLDNAVNSIKKCLSWENLLYHVNLLFHEDNME